MLGMTSNFRTKLKARKPTPFATMPFEHEDGSMDQRVIIKPTHADKQAILQGAVDAGELTPGGANVETPLAQLGLAARIVSRLLYVDGVRAFGDSSVDRDAMLAMPDYEEVAAVALKAFGGESVDEVKANFPSAEAETQSAED